MYSVLYTDSLYFSAHCNILNAEPLHVMNDLNNKIARKGTRQATALTVLATVLFLTAHCCSGDRFVFYSEVKVIHHFA